MKPVFEIFNIHFLFYENKNTKKVLDVDNKCFYGLAKYQREIFCIPAYTKIKNPNKSDGF
jgi:hypothetical protein